MKKTNKKGFTLIEVVLVLAIGGLIFLLAFLAFRNASVNRRDTQRRSDASEFISEAANYSSDAGGRVPASADKVVGVYIKSPWLDPQGKEYKEVNSVSNIGTSEYVYETGKVCDGNTFGDGQSNDYAIVMGLEKGQVCRDSGN